MILKPRLQKLAMVLANGIKTLKYLVNVLRLKAYIFRHLLPVSEFPEHILNRWSSSTHILQDYRKQLQLDEMYLAVVKRRLQL